MKVNCICLFLKFMQVSIQLLMSPIASGCITESYNEHPNF